jgi:hypothetical protein
MKLLVGCNGALLTRVCVTWMLGTEPQRPRRVELNLTAFCGASVCSSRLSFLNEVKNLVPRHTSALARQDLTAR